MNERTRSTALSCRGWQLVCGLAVSIYLSCLEPAAAQLGRGGMQAPGGGSTRPTAREEFQSRLIMEGGPNYGPAQPTPLILDVRIIGNETTPESDIISQLKTRKDRYFDPEVIQSDVHRLVTYGKFRNVKVYPQPVPGGMVVTFEVFEVPTIHYIRFLGNRGLSDKRLLNESALKVNDPLNRFGVEEGRRKIEALYHSKGFSKATVSIFEGDLPEHRGVVYLISEGTIERILSTNFIGNTFVSSERLETIVKTKPTFLGVYKAVVDRDKIDEDVDRLTSYYRSFGFFAADISRELEFDESGKWLTLTFVINEGPRYAVRNVSVQGNTKFTSDSLMSQLGLQPGQYFDLNKMNADRGSLLDAYGGRGYIFADIVAEPLFLEQPGQLDLVYNIEEGELFRVGRINVHIDGEYPHTRRSVILNRISLFPMDIVDAVQIRASESRLMQSQLFENNRATGVAPKIVIRPPELQELERLAQPQGGQYRGQNPSPPWER
jgi:outer membrane protein insertion porin family